MNILHVTAQRPDSTGSGVYLGETVRALRDAGHRQAVVAGVGPADPSPFPPDIRFEPVRFETEALPFPIVGMSDVMPYRTTRYRDLSPEMTRRFKEAFSGAFDRVFGDFAPDVVICHHLYLVCAVLMEWLARHPQARAACSVRGVCHNTDLRQFKAHALERDYIRAGVRALDRACALHDAQAQDIADTFGIDPARVRVTGTGYNGRVFSPGRAPRENRANRLVYVGKLWKQKGLMELFGALGRLPAGLRERLRLELAGGYSDVIEFEEIAARACVCPVDSRFLGQLGHADLAEAYRRADVFVLPSFSEGLPLVAVEAMACGCKVVITDLPGIRSWFSQWAPGAPVWYVAPPRMRGSACADDPASLAAGPDPEDAVRFERDLARALQDALAAPAPACDLAGLSWGALAERLVEGAGGGPGDPDGRGDDGPHHPGDGGSGCDGRAGFQAPAVRQDSGRPAAPVGMRSYRDAGPDEKPRLARRVAAALDEAIEKGFVTVFYHPIIRVASGRVCGYEALVRWEDPHRGPLSPAQFIPVLEECRLIHKLDCFILRKVCEDLGALLGSDEPAAPVSVSFSPLDFELCDVFERAERYRALYGIPREMIDIEVAESALNGEPAHLRAGVDRFRDAGYRIWIDDFGGGYPLAESIVEYDSDVLRLNLGFTRGYGRGPQAGGSIRRRAI